MNMKSNWWSGWMWIHFNGVFVIELLEMDGVLKIFTVTVTIKDPP